MELAFVKIVFKLLNHVKWKVKGPDVCCKLALAAE